MNVRVKVSKPLNIPSAKRHPADGFNQEVIKDPDLRFDPENLQVQVFKLLTKSFKNPN